MSANCCREFFSAWQKMMGSRWYSLDGRDVGDHSSHVHAACDAWKTIVSHYYTDSGIRLRRAHTPTHWGGALQFLEREFNSYLFQSRRRTTLVALSKEHCSPRVKQSMINKNHTKSIPCTSKLHHRSSAWWSI